jgi:hypothetical protein
MISDKKIQAAFGSNNSRVSQSKFGLSTKSVGDSIALNDSMSAGFYTTYTTGTSKAFSQLIMGSPPSPDRCPGVNTRYKLAAST